jgi:hypothetical protein
MTHRTFGFCLLIAGIILCVVGSAIENEQWQKHMLIGGRMSFLLGIFVVIAAGRRNPRTRR